MPLTPGMQLASYEILAPLGAGGMGEVYRARDTRLGREVAIKVLPQAIAGDPEGLARLEREARTVAGLNHPNIVVLHSVEEHGGVRFLTMELVEGQDLGQVVQPGGLPLDRVLALALPLAEALAAAHARGVVHRDLKPANVRVTPEGRVKVLDFGLAKVSPMSSIDPAQATTATMPRTTAGQLVGTVPYMAPEQIRGEPADARADLFAFGVLLFELLTGRRPFVGATAAVVCASILRDAPPPLPPLRPDAPGDLVELVQRCLEKDPDRRVPTARQLRGELDAVRRALESGQAPKPAPAPDLPSVAVLLFENRSRDEADDFFADGMTEAVIAQLCKVRTLRVISRTSVMPFKKREASLAEVAAALHVASVLEGTVRRVGDRVRIVAQLIDAGTGQHLWAETYDRQLTDIFVIQTDVALRIAAALKAELLPREQERMQRKPTRDVLAYEHYLRGRQSFVRFTAQEMSRSLEHFEKAIARDPEFALAYVGLSLAYTELVVTGALRPDPAGTRAKEAAAKALSLDPELGEAHSADASARLTFDFDWAGAEAGFKRALELAPSSSDTYDLYGRLCSALGRFSEAVALCERANELDPLTHRSDFANALLRAGRTEEAARAAARGVEREPYDARLHATLGWALIRQGQLEAGLEQLQRAVALAPDAIMWQAQVGQAYAQTGRADEAREILRQLEDPARPVPVRSYYLAYVYTGLGETDRALDCLERALEEGGGPMTGIKGSFLLAPLRDHPRFQALLQKMRQA